MRFRKLRIAWSVVWGTLCLMTTVGWLIEFLRGHHYSAIPSAIFAALTAALAITPMKGIGFRFSLRTLLIVTTLLAVVLGLIVYTTRQ